MRVRDGGVGMSAETLDRLFTPFVQAEATLDRSRGGLGLGLALVRGIVDLHGGTVTLDSGPGRGTIVTFALPVESTAATADEPPRRREAPGARAGGNGGQRPGEASSVREPSAPGWAAPGTGSRRRSLCQASPTNADSR